MTGEQKPAYLRLLDTFTARQVRKAEEEAKARWDERERKADAKLSEVAEQNRAIAFNLGFPDVESYFLALDSQEGRSILKIAINNNISWEGALIELRHELEKKDQREWEVQKSLRKVPQRGGEGSRGLTNVDERNIRIATAKKPKVRMGTKGNPTWKEKIIESKWWQNSLEAQRLGITVDELIELRVNREYDE